MQKSHHPPRPHRLLLFASCLALCAVNAGCPATKAPTTIAPPSPGASVINLLPNTLTKVTISATALTSPAQLKTPSYLTSPAQYHVMGTQIETPVNGAIVTAKPTDGSTPIQGTTNAEGKVALDLDSTKVYVITVDYEIESYVDGQLVRKAAQLESIIKPKKSAAQEPPSEAKVDVASTLVSKAIAQSRSDLTAIDTTQVAKAIETVKTAIEKAPEAAAMLAALDTSDKTSVNTALRDIAMASDSATKAEMVATINTAASSVASNESNATPTAPPPVEVIKESAPEVTISDFIVTLSDATLYRPFPNGVSDPSYPSVGFLSAETRLSDNTISKLARWSVPENSPVSCTGGIFSATNYSEGADPNQIEPITVSCTSFFDKTMSFRKQVTIYLKPTPLEVRNVTLRGPENLVLYPSADGSQPGDNNLGKPSSQQLECSVLYNNQKTSKKLNWSVSPAGAAAIDANGLLTVLPGAPAGNVTVMAQSSENKSKRATFTFTVGHASQLDVGIE